MTTNTGSAKERPYDVERAARMLRTLRDVRPSERLETLAVVIRIWLDSNPSPWQKPELTEFFAGGRYRVA